MNKETSALGLTDQHDSTQNRHEGEDDSEAKIAKEIDLEVEKDFDGGSSESILRLPETQQMLYTSEMPNYEKT